MGSRSLHEDIRLHGCQRDRKIYFRTITHPLEITMNRVVEDKVIGAISDTR